MKFLMLVLILFSCASNNEKKKLSQKEQDALYIKQLKKIRPLLLSDDFPYMECEEEGSHQVVKQTQPDIEFWKSFGLLELREKGVELRANIMALKYVEIEGKHQFNATFYNCEKVTDVKLVDEIGMCKPSEQKVFKLPYALDESRAVGEEIISQVIRHHAIKNYYKTYAVDNVKYSYTKKELQASAKFYECF
tara:strand:- start:9980 stop:10555 length:576 start_codon:yes stop_codon:yes gene_type:complete